MPLTEDTPDHSSLTRVRDRLPLEVHAAVFEWALRLVAEKGLLPGNTAAIDSTFLEANAAMKSIVRRDTGEDWNDYLRRLLKEQHGVEDPTDDELPASIARGRTSGYRTRSGSRRPIQTAALRR